MNTYGSLNLTESSPSQSFEEPLSLDEVKAFLKLPANDDADEDLTLDTLIAAAREQAEILQGRDLVRKQFDLSLDYWRCPEIELRPHLASVDLVRYRDSEGNYTDLAEDSDYVVDVAKQPGIILPPYSKTWPSFTPWPSSAILIRFTAGLATDAAFWNDVGARVKLGMKQLILSWFDQRLPFVKGASAIQEYPYRITALLSFGAVVRVF